MRRRPLRALFSALVLAAGPAAAAAAQQVEQLIAQANTAEEQQRFAEAAQLYERLHGVIGFDPNVLYLAAINSTRAGQHAAALRSLRRAVDDGFAHIERLERDSTFRPLHGDSGWTALLMRARARAAAYHQPLRTELLKLAEDDQKNRSSINDIVTRHGRASPQADSAFARLAAADAPLLARVKEIVERHGWPDRRLVADDGAHAAWLLVQHAPAEYQHEVLPLIQAAAAAGHARPADAAMLDDRVRVANGGLQRFGSQLRWPETGGGAPSLSPIEDEPCVEQRRAAAGLESLVDYLKRFGVSYTAPAARCAALR